MKTIYTILETKVIYYCSRYSCQKDYRNTIRGAYTDQVAARAALNTVQKADEDELIRWAQTAHETSYEEKVRESIKLTQPNVDTVQFNYRNPWDDSTEVTYKVIETTLED